MDQEPNRETRHCEHCAKPIRKKHQSAAEYAARRYCGIVCSNTARQARRTTAATVTRPQPSGTATWDRDRDWDERAACRGQSLALFYGPDGERGHVRRLREARARAVCQGCPVRLECLSWALRSRERYGVYGGTGEAERSQMIRRLVRS